MDRAQITRGSRGWTAATCALLLAVFAILSWSAVETKNASIDEPTHSMSGWLELRTGDFRLETVNPPLWKCWAAIGNFFDRPPIDRHSVVWNKLTWDPVQEVIWSARMLYDTPGFDGDAFVNRSRAMMLSIAVALGILIAFWSYQLSGPVGAIAATVLYCFDPNFIAQGPLVKSDVAFSLVLLGFSYACWRFGQRASWLRAVEIGLLCGIAVNVKFSGLIVGPMLALLLLIRVILPTPWNFPGQTRSGFFQRLMPAIATGLLAAVICYGVSWACYDFRFRPSPEADVRMNMAAILAKSRAVETTVALGHKATDAEIIAHGDSVFDRSIMLADAHQLLPQSMLAGLLYQHSCVQLWPAFLNGELYGTGRWYYFPLAMLYKTPVAELIAFLLAAGILIIAVLSIMRGNISGAGKPTADEQPSPYWTITCLLCPATIFLAAALTAHLNIGLRNLLPLYPFLQIASGCAAAIFYRFRPGAARGISIILGLFLAMETASAWPDYIAFFNFPTGGPTGGLTHLSDSNLDWGQDIKGLGQWQKDHLGLPLYAKLFESLDPAFYGVNYHPILIAEDGPLAGKPSSDIPMTTGYVAISATGMQGLYIKPYERWFYQRLRQARPVAVIGGTIYIYEYRPSS